MSDETTPQDDSPEDRSQQRLPEFLTSRSGRMITTAGLLERVIRQFQDEFGPDSPRLQAAKTDAQRRGLVREVGEYVFQVESAYLSPTDQARILKQAYSELFGYGPLDALLADERITTIAIEGVEKIAVRYGPGAELTRLDPIFEDGHHLKRVVDRLLTDAGVTRPEESPIIEIGMRVEERPISISLALPPTTTVISADIRLHPRQPVTLQNMIEQGYISDASARFLQALAASEHGFAIVGDTESGKTTLLAAVVPYLRRTGEIIALERTGELHLPDDIHRMVIRPPGTGQDHDGAADTFGQLIRSAVQGAPAVMLLDEVRADEPGAVEPLLLREAAPRQIWVFRGASEPRRLASALGMLARMGVPSHPEGAVHTLHERLPFVVVVKRRRGYLQLRQMAEWQFSSPDAAYPDYVPLLDRTDHGLQPTGSRPVKALDLPEDFWRGEG